MEFVNMLALSEEQLMQAARMLSDELPMGWANADEAREEIRERLLVASERYITGVKRPQDEEENYFVAAMDGGEVIGWCGILPSYGCNVYELHPLVVRHDLQRQGVGAALVWQVEEEARRRGGLTLWLGADDEVGDGETSLANVDLYDDLPERIRSFDPGTHQTAFYLKQGFKVVGVMPDAGGIGKPDIYMAKRL